MQEKLENFVPVQRKPGQNTSVTIPFIQGHDRRAVLMKVTIKSEFVV